MNAIGLIRRYLKYYFTSKTKFKIHSPFVYDFITNVLEDNTAYNEYQIAKLLFNNLSQDDNVIEVADFGAGATSFPYSSSLKRISKMAQRSSIKSKYGELLFRIVKYYKPETIIEVGTSLGISTTYLALSNPLTKIISLEGCSNTAAKARENFDQLKLKNIEQIIGNADIFLSKLCKKTDKIDFVFFDANHKKKPTIEYFEQCLEKSHNDTIFVFDDINWSSGMVQAWDYIKNHQKVKLTIDIFFLGIVFFKKELSKENFTLKF
ncbi:MAG: class I SAM-dependent methyltransferase [Bacteroidales bacterium]|nr:class I SAM-dependent methyltransferase [Bacteroidales bacterium]